MGRVGERPGKANYPGKSFMKSLVYGGREMALRIGSTEMVNNE